MGELVGGGWVGVKMGERLDRVSGSEWVGLLLCIFSFVAGKTFFRQGFFQAGPFSSRAFFRLAGWLAGCLVCCLTGWLAGRLDG